MINGDPLWHVSAIKLWANWSSFNKINDHMVPSNKINIHMVPFFTFYNDAYVKKKSELSF